MNIRDKDGLVWGGMRGLAMGLLCLGWVFWGEVHGVGAEGGAEVEGVWRWNFTMPDGSVVRPLARLHQSGDRVTGATRFKEGSTVSIEDGKIRGREVQFKVVRRRDQREFVTIYQGVQTEDRIKGTIQSNWQGDVQTYPWEAERTLDGTWKWTVVHKDKPVEVKLKLRQDKDREKYSGQIVGYKPLDGDIHKGRYRDGDLSFEMEREVGGEKRLFKYRGKVKGDHIQGTLEVEGAKERTVEWRAERD